MGIYLNPGCEKFRRAVNSEIYVDKSELIAYTNKVLNTMQQYLCVSRPRRFGKSMTADMLAAYYSRGADARELFSGLKISKMANYLKYLNQYDTLSFNMQEFFSKTQTVEEMLALFSKNVLWELLEEYPDFRYFDPTDLSRTMQDIYQNSHRPFIVILDEWDCVFREYKEDERAQKRYLDFLRDFLKDKAYLHLVYMTGILPIKKYGTHSALNMFDEFSMLYAGPLAQFTGFTEEEVEKLARQYEMEMEEVKSWYDGYLLDPVPAIYNPRSVVSCMQFHKYQNYWNQTETFEALRMYIDLDFDGLRDAIWSMMAGKRLPVQVESFSNDMSTFRTKDDVMTLLVHLGYLSYDFIEHCVFIPNQEIQGEFVNAVAASKWGAVSEALKASFETLHAIWNRQPDLVAKRIEQAHLETSHLQYNDENALSYTISLALYSARSFYTIHRELPTGKGFADLVFLPHKTALDKPALLVELKWNKSAKGAISQIKKKDYPEKLQDYQGNLLLVGINYNKGTRKHVCQIEEFMKI